MGKTLVVDMTGSTPIKNEYNLKGVTDLVIKTVGGNDFLDGIEKVTATGTTFNVTIKVKETEHQEFTIAFKNVSDATKLNVKAQQEGQTTYYYNQTASTFYDEEKFVDARKDDDWVQEGSTTVAGSVFDDIIKFTDSETDGYTINSGKGNDTITGSTGADTITGGAGDNTIKYSNGNDRIILTKDEKMTLDLSGKGIVADDISFTRNKNNDLILNIDKDNFDTVTLDKYVKSNGAGKNGLVQYTLDGANYKNFEEIELYADAANLTFDKKKTTGSYTGTRFNDYVEILGNDGSLPKGNDYKFSIKATTGNNTVELREAKNSNTITTGDGDDKITLENTGTYNDSKRVTTVKAGNGTNDITIEGLGNNSIVTGKGDDTFTFNGATTNLNSTVIKAGSGKNTIKIKDDVFKYGHVTIAEEKVKAENNIVIKNIGDVVGEGEKRYSLIKEDDDLRISNDLDSSVVVSNYFANVKKKAVTTFNGQNLDDIVDENNMTFTVYGTKKVEGTKHSDDIQTLDSQEGIMMKINDKVYSREGDDKINAGLGKNSIYMYSGDGADEIVKGGGEDTLIFVKGSKIRFGHDGDDLKIYYSSNETDYALLKGVVSESEEEGDYTTYEYDLDKTSVKKIKIGSKTYKLKDLLDRTKINGTTGTVGNDDIFVNAKKGKVTIVGDAGSDIINIGSNDDKNEGNVDPANYKTKNITPTVYTYTTDGVQDTSEGTVDRVNSYAKNGGTYWAQSAISDIKVYGDGTNDTYNTYYNNQFTKIYDESGTSDVLNIKDKAHSDLKLIFDVTKDYKDWKTEIAKIETITEANKHDIVSLMVNSLQEVKFVTSDDRAYFLLNTDENNDIGIDIDYWGDKDAHDSEGEFDEKTEALLLLGKDKLAKFGGGVEKICASDGYYITSDDIAQVASNVASWLTDKGYASVDEVLTAEKTEGDMAALLQVFDDIKWTNPNPELS